MRTKNWAFLVIGLLLFSYAAMTLGLLLALRYEIPMLIEPIFNKRVNAPWVSCLNELSSTEVKLEETESANRWLAGEVVNLRTALTHNYSLLDSEKKIKGLVRAASSKKPPPAPGEKRKVLVKKEVDHAKR